MFNQKKDYGFSLVEVTVTLAIIALLIAAVTAAQGMKRSLELKQVVDQVSSINQAITIFRGETPGYSAIPGDYVQAEATFGQDNVGNKIDDDAGDGNGDGDNLLETDLTTPSRDETLLFWQHLAAAGLIEGSYDNTDTPTGRPEGPIRNSIFGVSTSTVGTAGTYPNAVHINISKYVSSGGDGILSSKEAYDIDLKYDDGLPHTGSMRAADGADQTAQDCVNTTTSPASYKLTNTEEESCVMHFYEREYN